MSNTNFTSAPVRSRHFSGKSSFFVALAGTFTLFILLCSTRSNSQSPATSLFKSDSITVLKLRDGTTKIGYVVQNRDSDFVFALYNNGPVIIKKDQVASLENKQKSSIDKRSYSTTSGIDVAHSKRVSIGIRGGLNLAGMHSNDNNSNKEIRSTLTWQGGSVINIPLGTTLSIQPELLFSRKGFGLNFHDLPEIDFGRVYINYLEVPVLLKAKLNAAKKIKITISGGGYAGYMISGANVSKANSIKVKEKMSGDDLKDINRFDYGIAAGTGLLFKAGYGDIGIDLRYDFGLSNLDKSVDDIALFNRVLSFSASYYIPL